ncbi:MAG: hypothetical protein GX359_11645 [Clostridiales bacterium]|nr:hypothetical protein [Clostridiales bacterium]
MGKSNLTRKNIESMAEATLYGVWACIDWDKVDARRAFGIWDEFASKAKAAAMTTNSYEKFVEKLTRKMGVRSLRYREIKDIHMHPDEEKQAVLKMVREETLQLVLKMRLNNEARKEMEKSLREQDEQQKELEERNRQVTFDTKGAKIDE